MDCFDESASEIREIRREDGASGCVPVLLERTKEVSPSDSLRNNKLPVLWRFRLSLNRRGFLGGM
jgi:hypothetical protein